MTTARGTVGAPMPPSAPGHNLDDRSRATADRMRGAGGAVPRAGVRLPRRVMKTKARLGPASEYGVMAAALGQRSRRAVAHQAQEMLAEAAPATRRPRMSWPG